MKKYSSGFTLIELLVVFAIITLLSSVIMASLNNARNKAKDTNIKTILIALKPNVELQYTNKGCYTNTSPCSAISPLAFAAAACPASGAVSIFGFPSIATQITSARLASANSLASCKSTAGGTAWAVAVQLKSNPLRAWCVDSTRASREVTITATQAGVNTAFLATGAACK
jgi:prepilin-type N-terminal cleavage/methylation domain-containing protein